MVKITLPDGSTWQSRTRRRFDVAAALGPGLARAALAGRVNGNLVDTSFRIQGDAELTIITERDKDGVEILRHSTAHLLAYAVKELFPDAQVTIGPVIENGFYYDFSFKRPFTPDDLEAIEKRMSELARKDFPVTREVWPRDRAVEYFKSIGEHYKAEIIASIPAGEEVSLYREGDFIDLCRGPHVPPPATQGLRLKVGGLLARGPEERNAATDLRHCLGTERGAASLSEDARGGGKARSSAAGRAARPVSRSGRVARNGVLAREGLGDLAAGRAVHASGLPGKRLFEVRCPQILDRSLWRIGPLGELRLMFTTESESATSLVPELPRARPDLQQGLHSYRNRLIQ
jgi:hypothetical protein